MNHHYRGSTNDQKALFPAKEKEVRLYLNLRQQVQTKKLLKNNIHNMTTQYYK